MGEGDRGRDFSWTGRVGSGAGRGDPASRGPLGPLGCWVGTSPWSEPSFPWGLTWLLSRGLIQTRGILFRDRARGVAEVRVCAHVCAYVCTCVQSCGAAAWAWQAGWAPGHWLIRSRPRLGGPGAAPSRQRMAPGPPGWVCSGPECDRQMGACWVWAPLAAGEGEVAQEPCGSRGRRPSAARGWEPPRPAPRGPAAGGRGGGHRCSCVAWLRVAHSGRAAAHTAWALCPFSVPGVRAFRVRGPGWV